MLKEIWIALFDIIKNITEPILEIAFKVFSITIEGFLIGLFGIVNIFKSEDKGLAIGLIMVFLFTISVCYLLHLSTTISKKKPIKKSSRKQTCGSNQKKAKNTKSSVKKVQPSKVSKAAKKKSTKNSSTVEKKPNKNSSTVKKKSNKSNGSTKKSTSKKVKSKVGA